MYIKQKRGYKLYNYIYLYNFTLAVLPIFFFIELNQLTSAAAAVFLLFPPFYYEIALFRDFLN